MKEQDNSLLYRLKKICYNALRGVLMEKERDGDLFFKDGPMGLLVEGLLMTLVLTIAILVLMLSGGSIEVQIKGIIEAFMR